MEKQFVWIVTAKWMNSTTIEVFATEKAAKDHKKELIEGDMGINHKVKKKEVR